jgi:hypothetical protein
LSPGTYFTSFRSVSLTYVIYTFWSLVAYKNVSTSFGAKHLFMKASSTDGS